MNERLVTIRFEGPNDYCITIVGDAHAAGEAAAVVMDYLSQTDDEGAEVVFTLDESDDSN